MQVDISKVDAFIKDLYEQYQREEEQAIMQRNMEKAVAALAGKDACVRLRNSLGLRAQMEENVVRMTQRQRRA
jgi:hypothetical protein